VDRILIDSSAERRILDLRPLGFRDVVVLGRYRYASAHQALETHSHGNMLEVCYLERGRQTYFVGNERFDLNGGDVFINRPGEQHGTGQSPEEKGVLFWMLINVSSGNRRFPSLPPVSWQRLVDALLDMPSRHFRAEKSVGKTLHRVFDVFDRTDDPLRIIELQNLILRFLLDVLHASRNSPAGITSLMRDMQRFIAENVDRALTVRELARQAGLSEPRFKARFSQEVGVPPAEYVMRRKIDHAKRMFQTGNASVTEAAMRLGFSSSQYFATVFRRYTGTTPSRYCKQIRSEGTGKPKKPSV